MEKKLEVKNLKISFRTVNGKVQAVRDVSFSLDKGETLAIVGESGSGKSVTSRAILGILASNAIVEGGEIIYDGQDLLKISEEDYHRIRGDKIAMIFQDPLSSLDPIVRIGKQMTEAMLLKNKANRRACLRDFNRTLGLLEKNMDIACPDPSNDKKNKAACKKFDDFEYVHIKHEQDYNDSHRACEEALPEIDNALFEIEKNAFDAEGRHEVQEIVRFASRAISRFVVREGTTGLSRLASALSSAEKAARKKAKKGEKRDYSELVPILKEMREIFETALKADVPNFFGLGYYLRFVNSEIPEMSVAEMNKMTRRELDTRFMLAFRETAGKGLAHSHEVALEKKKKAVDIIEAGKTVFTGTPDPMKLRETVSAMTKAVEESIDRMELIKDSLAYTFGSSLRAATERLIKSERKNAKEQKRFDKQSAKLSALIAGGKDPGWKVVPADIADIDELQNNILHILKNLTDHYGELLSADNYNAGEKTLELIDYLKEKASGVVYRITPGMAKNKALKLMEEVGIPEPRKRYTQYPFQFSGGMRQRIVIAIALSANPDILICDEPTTALDVTIQAQILELINKLKAQRNLTVIFITHDLGVVANMASRIAVMYAGKIVEYGTADDIFYNPAHPYTWALLSSMPDLDTNEKLEAIPGTPPNMIYPPKGDAFAARNKYAMKIDFEEEPPMFRISDTHGAATWLLHPDAPKVEAPKIVTERIARMKKAGGIDNEQ